MKLLILFCLFSFSIAPLGAQTLTSEIHSFDIDPQGDDHFIKLTSGEVIFVDDLAIIDELQNFQYETLEFRLDKKRELVQWRSLGPQSSDDETLLELEGRYTTSPDFRPSVVSGKASLNGIFAGLRKDSKRRSECFHRAYIWAYEEYRKSHRHLTKHFLFFTRRYIREYRYKWWFHVAPSVLYAHENGKQEFMMLDREFNKGPATVKEWTDGFIASKRSCPVVYVYSHYHNNQESEHCYLIPTPMYYLQPLDIENFEKRGVEKKDFMPGDLNISYRRGFSGPRL